MSVHDDLYETSTEIKRKEGENKKYYQLKRSRSLFKNRILIFSSLSALS